MILLLNNKDIFEEKITRSTLKICFPEYTGADEYAEASKYIKGRFKALNKTGRHIYTLFTCVADTGVNQFVFDAVTDMFDYNLYNCLKKCRLFGSNNGSLECRVSNPDL